VWRSVVAVGVAGVAAAARLFGTIPRSVSEYLSSTITCFGQKSV